jgi:hypothetical protein
MVPVRRAEIFSSRGAGEYSTSSKPAEIFSFMKTEPKKKQWITPRVREVRIFFECTCYAGAV